MSLLYLKFFFRLHLYFWGESIIIIRVWELVYIRTFILVLMRDEMNRTKKQARSNKQGKATQHTQGSHMYIANA